MIIKKYDNINYYYVLKDVIDKLKNATFRDKLML